MKKIIPAMAIAIILAAGASHAAAPPYIPVQGVLTDSSGAPIDTSVSATFSLYTSEVGGTALWTETQSVLVEDGLFTAYLGEETALDLVTFRDNGDLWLGIAIESDPEMDRVYLGSNPYAGYAEYCGNIPDVDFTDLTGSVDPADLPAGVVVGALSCTGTAKVSGIDSSGGLVCSADVDTDTDTNTNAATLCSSGQYLDGDGSCHTVPVDTNAATLCGNGYFLNGDGTCDTVGDITSVAAGTGLSGGSTSGAVTLNVDYGAVQRRVAGSCTSGSSIRQIYSNGNVVCESDTYYNEDLTCYTEVDSHTVSAGTSWSYANTCSIGRVLVGGGFNFYGAGSDVWIWENGPDRSGLNAWDSRGYNLSSAEITVYVQARCCNDF